MTKAQIESLRREVEQMAAAGASRNEFREWADSYYFGIEDLYGQRRDEAGRQSGN